jgi:hypothetical protein
MCEIYYSHAKGVHDWLSENIGPSKSHYAGHGWVMVNNFNTYARRQTSFWVEFEDWVSDEQLVAFRLTWSYESHM